MPRNVRNFWIDARIDGRRSSFASGPRCRDGGFTEDIYIRRNGSVAKALVIVGYLDFTSGDLLLDVENVLRPGEGNARMRIRVER